MSLKKDKWETLFEEAREQNPKTAILVFWDEDESLFINIVSDKDGESLLKIKGALTHALAILNQEGSYGITTDHKH